MTFLDDLSFINFTRVTFRHFRIIYQPNNQISRKKYLEKFLELKKLTTHFFSKLV